MNGKLQMPINIYVHKNGCVAKIRFQHVFNSSWSRINENAAIPELAVTQAAAVGGGSSLEMLEVVVVMLLAVLVANDGSYTNGVRDAPMPLIDTLLRQLKGGYGQLATLYPHSRGQDSSSACVHANLTLALAMQFRAPL